MSAEENAVILVAGATGILGSQICRMLVEQGKTVRALVRSTSDPGKVDNLKQLGVELVVGDLKDRASLDAACQGVASVITTVATTISRQPNDSIRATDLEGQKSLVDAASAAGVQHFVYLSVSGVIPAQGSFIEAKRAVEEYLRQSGLTYTIVRPGPFMEVWLSPFVGFDIANARVQVFGSGEGKLSWTSLGDVAECAIGALDHPAAHNATLELVGPEWLSHLEVIRLCEEISGRPFEVQHVLQEDLLTQLMAATDERQQALTGLMLFMAQGETHSTDMQATLQAVPLRRASVRDFITSSLSR